MTRVMTVIPAEGAILNDVLDAMCQTVNGGLNRRAYGKFHAARKKTTWGGRGRRLFALVEGEDILASAEQYDLAGVFEGRPTRVCGVGSVSPESSQRDIGHARVLIDTPLDNAARDGAEMALLFSHTGVREGAGHGFQTIHLMELTLNVTESSRRGARWASPRHPIRAHSSSRLDNRPRSPPCECPGPGTSQLHLAQLPYQSFFRSRS
jgi:hypothetical protein